jgi:subtilisin family serine protease
MALASRPPMSTLRNLSLLAAFAGTLLLVAGVAPSRAGPPPNAPPERNPVRAEVRAAAAASETVRVIVTLREPSELGKPRPALPELRDEIASRQNAVLAAVPEGELELAYRYLAVPAMAGRIGAQGLGALARHPDVADVSLDAVGEAATTQSLPLIFADVAYAQGITGEGVTVAVLDTGIDTDHADLADSIAYERCYLTESPCPPQPHPAEDDVISAHGGHGTNVSGIITGNGTVAPRGVAPDAQIAAYKILDAAGVGLFSDWLAGLDDIIANHPEVDIVNMSLQSGATCAGSAIEIAISTLHKLGKVTFVASGNHGEKQTLLLPACAANALTVGAVYDSNVGSITGWKGSEPRCTDTTTAADKVACWSDSSNSLDLLAPGARTTSTGVGGGTITYTGTSQASPHAAGVAALLLEVYPDLSPDEVELRLEATGKLLTDPLRDTNPSTNRTTPRVDARVATIADGVDSDLDGCVNIEEYGIDAMTGGRRNPLNRYDFYDTSGDRSINVLEDVLPVIQGFGPASGTHYDAALDRAPAPPNSEIWDMGPPDGTIDVDADIRGVAAQFGHSCAGLP